LIEITPLFKLTKSQMSYLKKFLPDETNKRMLVPMAAFFVAALAASLGFIAAHWSIRWLYVISFLITAASIVIGTISVITGVFQSLLGTEKSDTREQ
jgi:fatty acid desaturase